MHPFFDMWSENSYNELFPITSKEYGVCDHAQKHGLFLSFYLGLIIPHGSYHEARYAQCKEG
jgi:hypothetical protein